MKIEAVLRKGLILITGPYFTMFWRNDRVVETMVPTPN